MPTALVVDDSSFARRLAGGLLERIECVVHYASDAKEALEKLALHLPDLVVTDLNMPEMNGMELMSALKREYPFIPVILMTAEGSEEIAAQALREGAASYVLKQKLAEDLVPTVERIWTGSVEDRAHPLLMHDLDRYESDFSLGNDVGVIRALTNHLQQMLRCLPLASETERLRVGVAVEEAIRNALYHGNLEIRKDLPAGNRKAVDELAQKRMREAPYRDRRIRVSTKIDRDHAAFVVRDEGPGFDISRVGQFSNAETVRKVGKGVILMRSIMDEVSFNERGNEVTLIKRRVPLAPPMDDEAA